MRSRWLIFFAILFLVSSGIALAQGKGKARGKATAPGQETAAEATTATHGEAHDLHAKKKGATKGKKKGQKDTRPGKGPAK